MNLFFTTLDVVSVSICMFNILYFNVKILECHIGMIFQPSAYLIYPEE